MQASSKFTANYNCVDKLLKSLQLILEIQTGIINVTFIGIICKIGENEF